MIDSIIEIIDLESDENEEDFNPSQEEDAKLSIMLNSIVEEEAAKDFKAFTLIGELIRGVRPKFMDSLWHAVPTLRPDLETWRKSPLYSRAQSDSSSSSFENDSRRKSKKRKSSGYFTRSQTSGHSEESKEYRPIPSDSWLDRSMKDPRFRSQVLDIVAIAQTEYENIYSKLTYVRDHLNAFRKAMDRFAKSEE